MKISNCMNWARAGCLAVLAGAVSMGGGVYAADHGDAPLMASDAGADMADIYFFMEPTRRNRVTLIQTQRGFIVPGEAENLAGFDPQINYRLAIENSGDAASDINANIRFSERTGPTDPQIATIVVTRGTEVIANFQAPTTPASSVRLNALRPVVTKDPVSKIEFFAGMTDDPFFFDVPAELLYRKSRVNNNINPFVFDRGRDTFAGYNVLSIALSIRKETLLGSNAPILGFSGYTERAETTTRSRAGGLVDSGNFVVIDRMGIPGINTVLVPYEKKDAYNRSTTSLDPPSSADTSPLGGLFAADIIASLQALQTGPEAIDVLANLAVLNGDYLRLDTSIENRGINGGVNEGAGFPNGRRLSDDVIDTVVTIINNFEPVRRNGRVDRVNGNDRKFRNTFPYLAPAHQPLPFGAVDGTEN